MTFQECARELLLDHGWTPDSADRTIESMNGMNRMVSGDDTHRSTDEIPLDQEEDFRRWFSEQIPKIKKRGFYLKTLLHVLNHCPTNHLN